MTTQNSYGKTADEMIDEIGEGFMSFRAINKFHVRFEKTDNGVTLKVEAAQETFLPAIREAYDKWHSMMNGNLGKLLGMPQIEHFQPPAPEEARELTQEEANELSNRDKREAGLVEDEQLPGTSMNNPVKPDPNAPVGSEAWQAQKRLDDEIPF